ncbi:MAG: hypothetical protein KGQ28_04600 [Hyphomicrobiales bacterium]|nr:hypothetical protein [Hyphomicrobiales bacterium]
MKLAFAIAVVGAVAFGSSSAVAQQGGTPSANPKVEIWAQNGDGGYRPVKSPQYKAIRDYSMRHHVLEEYAAFMAPIKLPTTLGIYMEECDGGFSASPHYSPGQHAIDMCYQFVALSGLVYDKAVAPYQAAHPGVLPVTLSRQAFVSSLFASVVLHETGHAIFDLLDVPIFGREEDAADEMSSVVAAQFQPKIADALVWSTALMWFGMSDLLAKMSAQAQEKARQSGGKMPCSVDPLCKFSDVHGTAEQRFFNTLCLAYGAHPDHYADVARFLPKDRDCKAEYARVAEAFAKTVWPSIDQAKMREVQAGQWLLPQEMR